LHVFESDKDQWIILAVAVVNVPFLALILLDNKSAEKLEVFLNDFAPSVCIDFLSPGMWKQSMSACLTTYTRTN